MTNLKIAAAQAIGHGSDVTFFTQKPISTLGFGVEETAILSPYGLDTICETMSLYHPPFLTGGEPHAVAHLYLQDNSWADKDAFIAAMGEQLDIKVQEERHPYKAGAVILYVSGLKNILKFGQELRKTYAEVHLEVDDLRRPLVHPEVVGELLDKVAEIAQSSPARTPHPFHANAYRPHDWQP